MRKCSFQEHKDVSSIKLVWGTPMGIEPLLSVLSQFKKRPFAPFQSELTARTKAWFKASIVCGISAVTC